MTDLVAIVRELHRLRRHAKDLREQIERAPRLLKGQQAKVARQKEAVQEAQEAIKKLKVANHEKEVQLKSTHQQIAKYEDQRNKAGGTKEYAALQTEIATARSTCQRLEDEILAGMTEVEERTAQVPELEKAVKQVQRDAEEFAARAQERLTGQTQQLAEVEHKIKDVEEMLPEEVRPQYNRLVQARGEDALAPVQDRTCTACYTSITSQSYNDLLSGRWVACKSCGRILYLPE